MAVTFGMQSFAYCADGPKVKLQELKLRHMHAKKAYVQQCIKFTNGRAHVFQNVSREKIAEFLADISEAKYALRKAEKAVTTTRETGKSMAETVRAKVFALDYLEKVQDKYKEYQEEMKDHKEDLADILEDHKEDLADITEDITDQEKKIAKMMTKKKSLLAFLRSED